MPEGKTDYGPGWWYSHDFIFNGKYNRMRMTVVKIHPEGTITNSQDQVVKKKVLELKVGETTKMLPLNSSNEHLGHKLLGEPPGPLWVGKELILGVCVVVSFGEPEEAIRIIPVGRHMSPTKRMKLMGVPAELDKQYQIVKRNRKDWVVEKPKKEGN